MAAGATLYRFEIELADSDRAVYESLELRVAQHVLLRCAGREHARARL